MNKNKRLLTFWMLVLIFGFGIQPAAAFNGKSNFNPAFDPNYSFYIPSVFNLAGAIEPPPPWDQFNFVAWSDTRYGIETLTELSKEVNSAKPAFTLFPGDLENKGFTAEGMDAWKTALNGNNHNRLFDVTFTVRGNHDSLDPAGWQTYFDMQGTSARIGAQNFVSFSEDLTYAFDYKNAIFIGVDVLGDAHLIDTDQLEFLDYTLADAENRGLAHAFLFFHGPPYPVGPHTECYERTCPTETRIAELITVLNRHPIVSATFHGHEHLQSYVHLDASRIAEITQPFEQIITGTAGSPPYDCDYPVRFDYCGSYPGFVSITVSGKSYTVKFFELEHASPAKVYTFTNE